MDPDANIKEQIEIAKHGVDCDKDAGDCAECCNSHDRLCELVLGLDEWIRKGGFLPATWSRDAR